MRVRVVVYNVRGFRDGLERLCGTSVTSGPTCSC